ncbi:MAG TPA: ATP-binding cassette domain-containing protein [Bryobacteraceae bacterium]|jgi:molybdate transport system ATP-binding protein|nr:ATP-binding cassette domain-containing protein [Bryobacteraceae bacterium]
MIEARIRKQFAAGRDSSGFSLHVEFETSAGVTVLFGPSGAGKTLTLDAIAGFVRPDEGRILLADRILFDAGAKVCLSPRHRRCGYVFQNYALFPHMNIRQNLEFAAERLPYRERRRRVNEMLERFRLEDVAGRLPHQASGGQRQRCSIARALLGAPQILLLDEPAQGLDAPLRSELYTVLRQVRSEFGTPVLLVTHDLDECFELGEQMLILRAGRVIQSGAPWEIVDRPANVEVARLLGVFNLIPCEIRALDPAQNASRLRFQEFDISGPYLPGHLIGDRVFICLRPDALRALPRSGPPGPNQAPATLLRVVDKADVVRLEFEHDIAVEMRRDDYDPQIRDWAIQFPARFRVL